MKHIKQINEFHQLRFDFSGPKLKIGDEILCIKNAFFQVDYDKLPKVYKYESGKSYQVTEVNKNSVKISDGNNSSEIFRLENGDNYFLYLWDYFKKLK